MKQEKRKHKGFYYGIEDGGENEKKYREKVDLRKKKRKKERYIDR